MKEHRTAHTPEDPVPVVTPEEAGRLYIAGPMSGLPDYNYPAFRAAHAVLTAQGYDVVTPSDIAGDATRPWSWWMRRALALLIQCDSVALLPGWERSRGARLEADVAGRLGMPLYLYEAGTLAPFRRDAEGEYLLSRILDGATHASCRHENRDPTMHCCDWGDVADALLSGRWAIVEVVP